VTEALTIRDTRPPLTESAELALAFEGLVIDERYRLITEMGRGAFGRVYLAEHLKLGTRVAVKLLSVLDASVETIRRFEREASAAARLRSPHAIEIYDFGQLGDGTSYIVMEMLVGDDLAKIVRRDGKPSVPRTLRLMRQLANALDAAHAQGVVHRDLKPENVFVVTDIVYDELVKVLDFGVARSLFVESSLTEAGSTIGTPGFLPPEQAVAGAEITPAADVYALAAMTLELLTGELPYAGKTAIELLKALLTESPRVPSQLGLDVPGLDDVFVKALAREPSARFGTAGAFVDALEEVFDAHPDGVFSQSKRSYSDHPVEMYDMDAEREENLPRPTPRLSGARPVESLQLPPPPRPPPASRSPSATCSA